MDRSYLSGASGTAPTPPAVPSIGYPTAGSPGVSPATTPGPYLYHMLIEELLAADMAAGKTTLPLDDQGGRVAHLHGHCHQKAFDAMGAVEKTLRTVPGLDVRPIESSCCGMSSLAAAVHAEPCSPAVPQLTSGLKSSWRLLAVDEVLEPAGASAVNADHVAELLRSFEMLGGQLQLQAQHQACRGR